MQPSCGRPVVTWIITRHNRLMVGVILLMPLLEATYDFDNIARRFETALNDVVSGSRSTEDAHELLRNLFAESFVFVADPIGWHVSEIANRISKRLSLMPPAAELLTETPVHELAIGEPPCTRSTMPIARIEKDLILQLTCVTVQHAGETDEIRTAAEQIRSACPCMERSATPFVDDPPCECRNCRITMA